MVTIAASLSKCLWIFLPRWSATHPCFLSETIHFSYNTWNLLGVGQNFSSLHSQSNCWGREHLLPWAGFHSLTSPSLLLSTYQNFNFFQPCLQKHFIGQKSQFFTRISNVFDSLSHSIVCSLILFTVSFGDQKLLIITKFVTFS